MGVPDGAEADAQQLTFMKARDIVTREGISLDSA